MHHPRNQERLALKPSRVSIDQDKRPPSPGTKPASARRPGVGGTARGGSVARVPVEYVANLQQQIFFLERKLEAVGGVDEPGGGGSLARCPRAARRGACRPCYSRGELAGQSDGPTGPTHPHGHALSTARRRGAERASVCMRVRVYYVCVCICALVCVCA